jgi:hypothetical protein
MKKNRKKHIIEKMLYMSELNKKNVYISKQIFDVANNYKLNIYHGDSLNLDIKKEWNIDGFDIVIGNPPYQDNSGNKGNKLWTKFVEHILTNNVLKKNGYLVFVHPSLWRQINHYTQKYLTERQLLYLEIHNEKDSTKTFRANTRYDWYVLKNNNETIKTVVKEENGIITHVDLRKLKFIPNGSFDVILKLTNSTNKVNILHSESAYEPRKKWMSSIKDDNFKFPCVYSINKKNVASFKYSNINDKGHFDIPKVIWGSGATGFIIDKNGKYGLTQWASAIVDDPDKLELIKKALESKKFDKLIKTISVSKAEINYKILREFNKNFYEEFIIDDDNILEEKSININKSSKKKSNTEFQKNKIIKKENLTEKNKNVELKKKIIDTVKNIGGEVFPKKKEKTKFITIKKKVL